VAGEVTFQLTEADCVAAHRDHLRERFTGRNAAIGTIISISILVAILILILASFLGNGSSWVTPYLLLALGFFWCCRAAAWFGVAHQARRLFRQRATFRHPITYRWSAEGFGYDAAHGSGFIPWREVHRWRAARHSFMLFTDDYLFYFIPRSALDDAQTKDLEATLAASGAPGPPKLEDGLIYS
jgi:hypothetical protein